MARAYVNFGRWIADCPHNCGSALQLKSGQGVYQCVECGVLSEVEWPANPDEIWSALEERRAPKNRNWFPSGHVLALKAGAPHGQTVTELREETAEFGGSDGASTR